MNHSINMAHLANQRPWGVELDLTRQTSGIKTWQQIHNYPIVGYSFQYFRMDPEKPLGDMYSLIIHWGKHIVQTKKSKLSFRLGIGPGYIERRFDREENYKNNLISTRLNYTLNGRINYSFHITPNVSVNAGLGIIHFSNGSMKVPNLGINIPSVHLGVGFQPTHTEEFKRDSLTKFKRHTEFIVFGAGGFKQVYPVDGKTYIVATLAGYINRRVNVKSALNIGVDIFYNGAYKQTIDSLGYDNPTSKYFTAGIHAGHEFYMHRLSVLTQLGFYVYNPLKLTKSVYQRYAFRYHLNKKVFILLGLKSHFGNADFVEWGVGGKF